ncbi:penicillin-binding protein 2 [Hydrotalea sp.]|uniref:penicillin-binding protein 2 n=1 Tax=Hydrotalea sp. TaxID=2881279 RepID=UPI003D0EBD73
MPVFNQSRSRVIQILFGVVFIIIAAQLVNLQVFSKKYKLQAENNAIYRKVIYPDRGIIFDRKKRSLLENSIMFDLVVTPSEARGIDTLALCNLLEIDTAEYKKRMRDIIFKNTSVRPSVFEPLLSQELYARLSENIYKFPGFELSERSVRSYPLHIGANFLGYTAEVNPAFLAKHKDEGYEMGDYTGMTGLERTYEKVLMGQRGIKRYIKDNRSRIQGSYENGLFDTAAIAGKNLYLSLDAQLQALGEKLMTNKVGSIVAIDPKTGGILCMVSAPSYDPNYLTGSERSKHFNKLYKDPRLPLLNRAIYTTYSPGSTFKTVVGIIGLSEGVINERFSVVCNGAFWGCGNGRPKCLDKGTFNLTTAIAHSDNTYFATVYKRILDQQRYGGADSALKVFNTYAYTFGLGHKLGIDLPGEQPGNLPISSYYRKIFGKNWNSCNVISNAIGQGEVSTTVLQLANVMATIANKGWYYTPHMVDSIEGNEFDDLLARFKEKHLTDREIPDSVYDAVQNGMQGVMEYGTGAAAQVPGIVVCGKTGTVQNFYHGVAQKDHAFFGAFAPRNNPKIAIAVLCENAGFGAQSAAPIASLMIEQYLKDSIPEPDRKQKVEDIAKLNLIPARMRAEMNRLDSIKMKKEEEEQNRQNIQEQILDSTSAETSMDTQAIVEPTQNSQSPHELPNTHSKSWMANLITTEHKKKKTIYINA